MRWRKNHKCSVSRIKCIYLLFSIQHQQRITPPRRLPRICEKANIIDAEDDKCFADDGNGNYCDDI